MFLLLQHGGLRYRAGELRVLPGSSADHVKVKFLRDSYPPEELIVHEVVVRHGPSSALGRLLPRSVVDCFPDVSALDDITRLPQYPPNFWSKSQSILDDMRRDVVMNYAAKNFPQALSSLLRPSSGNSLTLRLSETGVSFVVRDDRPDSSAAARARVEFDSIPVQYEAIDVPPPVEDAVPTVKLGGAESVSAPMLISSGSGIVTEAGSSPGFQGAGTLGCFVRTDTNTVALLTSWFAVEPASVGDWILRRADARRIAKIIRIVRPITSPPGATLSAGTVIMNRFDAALAAIEPGIRVTNEFADARVRPIENDGIPQLGDFVFKVGMTSGTTYGRIVDLQVVTPLTYYEGQAWFENLLMIEGTRSRFAEPGDGGAVIVRQADGAAVGILLGGTDHIAMASPIQPLLEQFDCALIAPRSRPIAP